MGKQTSKSKSKWKSNLFEEKKNVILETINDCLTAGQAENASCSIGPFFFYYRKHFPLTCIYFVPNNQKLKKTYCWNKWSVSMGA